MIYRRDLIDHFEWLAGSRYLEEFCDEALIAVAMTAYGHGDDWVKWGGPWMTAEHFVARYDLRVFVDRLRDEDELLSSEEEESR
jgi:hypothetical protein